jgi:nucleoside-diphosphate-sugar epimerase
LDTKIKKILITGSTGYIGSEFIDKYSEDYNISRFSNLRDSLCDLDLSNIDVILHFAALVHKTNIPYEDYEKVNANYPYDLAKKAKKNGVNHFIFLSSIAVYGDNKTIIRSNTKTEPNTNYGISKLKAENLISSLRSNTFKVSIIRPPMVYGNNAPGNINKLIKLIKFSPILPFGNINNQRSFIYIKNLIYIINIIIKNKNQGIFLVSDYEKISTSDLIKKLANSLNIKTILFNSLILNFILKKYKPNLHSKLYFDLVIENEKYIEELDIKLPYSIDQGINEIIN